MPKAYSYKYYISSLIYPLSGDTLLTYKVHSHVKYCAILHSDFDHDTSVVLIVYFFLVYESYTITRHHFLCKSLITNPTGIEDEAFIYIVVLDFVEKSLQRLGCW